MPQINVLLPDDRSKTGTLTLVDDGGGILAGPFQVGGRADLTTAAQNQNSGLSPLLRFGNTPLGSYRIDGFQSSVPGDDANRHGPNGKIKLTPTGGDAQLAAANGRQWLQIHGGYLSPAGTLRPTNGCLRLSNADMASLITAILLSGQPPNQCRALTLDVSNGGAVPVEADGDDGDGDPPTDSPAQPMPSPLP